MKVELDVDETWGLMSHVLARIVEDASLSDKDKANVRRWRSQTMKPSDEPMRLLTRKINEDLGEVARRKDRSQIRKPDWR